MDIDILSWLEHWYQEQTNGDWEHQHGVSIETLDNPGWRVVVDLEDIALSMKEFERKEIERSEIDWLQCWVNEQQFHIACGATNLKESLEIFRARVEFD